MRQTRCNIDPDLPAECTGAMVVRTELDAQLLARTLSVPLTVIVTPADGPDQIMVADLAKRPFVLISLDADAAGGKAAGKWFSALPNATPAPPWGGKDHTDAHLAGHNLGEWFGLALTLAGHQAPPATTRPEPAAAPTPPTPPAPAGPEIPAEVEGLPCGGCGATKYRRVVVGYEFPDGTCADGWSCGSPGCHVKLLSGNQDMDNLNRPTKRNRTT